MLTNLITFFLDKHVKDLLSKLLHSGYFESVPVLRNSKEKAEEVLMQSEMKKQLLKSESIKESGLLQSLKFFSMLFFETGYNYVAQVGWTLIFHRLVLNLEDCPASEYWD